MRAAKTTPGTLLADARKIATEREPWAVAVYCSVSDYVEAGCKGAVLRLPIPRPMAGNEPLFSRFTHPLNASERVKELAREAKENTHVVTLIPDAYIARGEIAAWGNE